MNRAILLVAFFGFLGVVLSGCANSPEALRDRGIKEFQTGRVERAKILFTEAYARRPSDAETLFYLGRIAHDEGRLGLAKYYYECSLDAKPGHAPARDWLAKVLEDQARSAVAP